MRLLTMTAMFACCLAAGSALAQPMPSARLPDSVAAQAGGTPTARSKSMGSTTERKPADEALASCLAQWDKATHMTRREWARACRRVADRLQNLRVN